VNSHQNDRLGVLECNITFFQEHGAQLQQDRA